MRLKGKDWKRFWGKKAAPKMPEWPGYGNFCKVTQNPHFLKKCNGGTKRNFLKIAQKVSLAGKAQQHSCANGIILLLVCTYTAKTGDDFGQKGGSKSARIAKLWKVSQNHPKPAFSEKVQREDQKNFFKNSQKFSPGLKGPKAHWLKWHYPVISIQLKCKDWRRFWRKQQFPKCPNGEVMAIFARSPKTRIFWKSAKRGPGEILENRSKSNPRLKGPKPLWRTWHYPLNSMHL